MTFSWPLRPGYRQENVINDDDLHRWERQARTSAAIAALSGTASSGDSSSWLNAARNSAAGSSAKAFQAALRTASERLANRPAATSASRSSAICRVSVMCTVLTFVVMARNCHKMDRLSNGETCWSPDIGRVVRDAWRPAQILTARLQPVRRPQRGLSPGNRVKPGLQTLS